MRGLLCFRKLIKRGGWGPKTPNCDRINNLGNMNTEIPEHMLCAKNLKFCRKLALVKKKGQSRARRQENGAVLDDKKSTLDIVESIASSKGMKSPADYMLIEDLPPSI